MKNPLIQKLLLVKGRHGGSKGAFANATKKNYLAV